MLPIKPTDKEIEKGKHFLQLNNLVMIECNRARPDGGKERTVKKVHSISNFKEQDSGSNGLQLSCEVLLSENCKREL